MHLNMSHEVMNNPALWVLQEQGYVWNTSVFPPSTCWGFEVEGLHSPCFPLFTLQQKHLPWTGVGTPQIPCLMTHWALCLGAWSPLCWVPAVNSLELGRITLAVLSGGVRKSRGSESQMVGSRARAEPYSLCVCLVLFFTSNTYILSTPPCGWSLFLDHDPIQGKDNFW